MWQAEDGKRVLLEHGEASVAVTVMPSDRDVPYDSAELLGGGAMSIERLPAQCQRDDDGGLHLQIEAGTAGLGPTYLLSAVVPADGGWRPASVGEPASTVVLLPDVGMGMYDDYDDDLGVPWAFPLFPLHRLA